MTIKTVDQLITEIDSTIIDNTSNLIIPAEMRTVLTDVVTSFLNLPLVGTLAYQNAYSVTISGGVISGVTLASSNVTISGGTITGVAISGSTLPWSNLTGVPSTLAGYGIPTFALSEVNDTNVIITLGGSPNTALVAPVSMTLGWSGTLAVNRGGTGMSTFATNGVLYGNSASPVQSTANATSTNKFLSQINGGAPVYNTIQPSDVPAINLAVSGNGGVTGYLPVANLNGGINASGNTFWAGDGTWKLASGGGGGTVTSVALTVPGFLSVTGSPITAAGTFAVSLATQAANTVMAGPTSGGVVAPTFRALVSADVPAINLATSGNGGVTGFLPVGNLNGGLNADNAHFWRGDGIWATPAGGGTVTSVSLTVPSFLSVSGSPVTGSGTFAVTLATQVANTVMAGPSSGGATTPTFRSLASADIPPINLASSGGGGVTGFLPVGNLNGGINADAAHFWCGNGTWVAVPTFSQATVTTGATIGSPYVVPPNVQRVLVATGAAAYIQLPLASSMTAAALAVGVLVKDVNGIGSTHNITIEFTSTEMCDGAPTVTIGTDYGWATVNPVPGGGAWYRS